jgi:hypothetical protein
LKAKKPNNTNQDIKVTFILPVAKIDALQIPSIDVQGLRMIDDAI